MESTLKTYFGYSTFRPYQKEIIEKILDVRDCLAVMATGSGKSLCYQVPPLVAKQTAIVISPLISLMQDQVMALKQRGIKAEHLSSVQTNSSAQSNAESGKYDILYMTPEKACHVPNMYVIYTIGGLLIGCLNSPVILFKSATRCEDGTESTKVN